MTDTKSDYAEVSEAVVIRKTTIQEDGTIDVPRRVLVAALEAYLNFKIPKEATIRGPTCEGEPMDIDDHDQRLQIEWRQIVVQVNPASAQVCR